MGGIEGYIGWTVEVHYLTTQGTSDRGVLADVTASWLTLTRNAGRNREEHLLVPVSAVRLLKPLSPPETENMRLLRPASEWDVEALSTTRNA